MTAYRVKNWSKFQHYKNRNPPWIRLHVEILDDYKSDGAENDFHALPDNDKLTLLLIWALASRYNGVIPSIEPAWLAVKLGIDNPSTDAIIRAGFLIPVSHASADASADANNTLATQHGDRVPETETETETDTETEGDARGGADGLETPAAKPNTPGKPSPTAAVRFEDLPPWLRTAPGMDSGIWAAWIDTRRRKRAAVGGSAIALCLRKLQARPDKAVSYLQLAIERGWQGVSWDWFDAAAHGQTGARNGYQRPDPEDVTPEVAASRAHRKQVFEVYLSAVKSAGRIPTKMELASLRAVNGAIPDDDWRSGCEWARNSSEFREIVQGHEQTNHGE